MLSIGVLVGAEVAKSALSVGVATCGVATSGVAATDALVAAEETLTPNWIGASVVSVDLGAVNPNFMGSNDVTVELTAVVEAPNTKPVVAGADDVIAEPNLGGSEAADDAVDATPNVKPLEKVVLEALVEIGAPNLNPPVGAKETELVAWLHGGVGSQPGLGVSQAAQRFLLAGLRTMQVEHSHLSPAGLNAAPQEDVTGGGFLAGDAPGFGDSQATHFCASILFWIMHVSQSQLPLGFWNSAAMESVDEGKVSLAVAAGFWVSLAFCR